MAKNTGNGSRYSEESKMFLPQKRYGGAFEKNPALRGGIFEQTSKRYRILPAGHREPNLIVRALRWFGRDV